MTKYKHSLRLATCLTVLGLASPAYADNLFLLQLGLFSTQEAANSQFEQVMESHDELLNGMRYISKKSRPISGGDETWRVLVGPYDNRKIASRACAELKESGQDCFVVETAAINLEEVESGTKLASSEKKPAEAVDETESNSDEIVEEAEKPVVAESRSDSSWDWFGNGADDKNEVEQKETETTSNDTGSSSSSNININTHSVYSKTTPDADVEINLADSIASLFDSSEESNSVEEEEVEDVTTTAEAAETLPVESSSNLNTTSSAPEEAKEEHTGEVEIAEAIPVPLTEPEDVPVTQSAPPVPEESEAAKEDKEEENVGEDMADTSTDEPAAFAPLQPAAEAAPAAPAFNAEPVLPREPIRSAPKRIPLSEYQQQTPTSRVLQISVFNNDRLAFQCLNTVQGTLPASTMLRSRIIKSSTGQAVLRLGPVDDAELETAICNHATNCGEQVQCRIIAEREMREPRRIRSAPAAAPFRGDRRRIESPFNRNAPMPRNLSPASSRAPTATTPSDGLVWVQLGTSSSESDAKSKFATLKSLYPDLLGSYEPTINTPENQSLGGRVYRLRIGSFDDRNKAQSLCASLSARGVGCLVLSK